MCKNIHSEVLERKMSNSTNNSTQVLFEMNKIWKTTSNVTFVILFVTGIFFNLLTILVMRTKSFKKMPISKVIMGISISDMFVTILLPFNKQLFINFIGRDLRAINLPTCKFFFFMWRVCKFSDSWFISLIAVERFLNIYFPVKVREIFSQKRLICIMVLILLCLSLFNGVWVNIADNIYNGICIPNKPSGKYLEMGKKFLIAGINIYAVIPTSIQLSFNALTIYKMFWNLKKIKEKKYLKEVKATITLLVISFTFTFLVVPVSLAHLITFLQNENLYASRRRPIVILREVTQTMEQTNYSINFLLYIMSSNSFRKHFYGVMLNLLPTKWRQNKVSPITGEGTVSVTKTLHSKAH